jgi:hypothetical protein
MNKRFFIKLDLLIREFGVSVSNLIAVPQGFGSIDQIISLLKMNLCCSWIILLKIIGHVLFP